jgi:hypothetical protein
MYKYCIRVKTNNYQLLGRLCIALMCRLVITIIWLNEKVGREQDGIKG